jgi:hyperosmotically inducible protein
MLNTVDSTEQDTSDMWVTTKVKADLLTAQGLHGGAIKVETNQGAVSLSSDLAVTESQKEHAVGIAKRINGVKPVTADGLKTEA